MSKIIVASDEYHFVLEPEIRRFNAPFWNLGNEPMPDLSNYEILRMYFLNASLPLMITSIRSKYPNLKIIAQVDSDYWWHVAPWFGVNSEISPEVMAGLRSADLVLSVNELCHNWYLENGIKSALGFYIVPTVNLGAVPSPKSFSERSKKAAIMYHSMPIYNICTNINIAKELDLKPVLIGTFHSNIVLKIIANSYGVFDAEIHERINNPSEYYSVLNDCLISLEDWYVGGSRFGIECGSIGLPIIGSENALSVKLLNPELTCKNGDVNGLVTKAKSLIEDENVYTATSVRIREMALSYFSEKECQKRFITLVKERLRVDLE